MLVRLLRGGEEEKATAIRTFNDEYFAVMNMPAVLRGVINVNELRCGAAASP